MLPVTVTVDTGEIVQIWDSEVNRYRLELQNVDSPKMTKIHAGQTLVASCAFPFTPENQVGDVLRNWLANAEGLCPEKVIESFELEDDLKTPVKEADIDLTFRLHTLQALLTGADMVIFGDSYGVVDFTGLVITTRELANDLNKGAGKLPAFVVFDEGETVGIPLIANRILEMQEGALEEVLVDF